MTRASPVADPDTGELLYVVNVFEDVTPIKRAQLAESLLSEERGRIAHILQRALLPESLAQIPGVEIQTLYAAAGELNEVGGDFYDVFDYDEDRTVLVIGDVCGKGPRAAGVTALARHTLRAAAIDGRSPTEMLATLHQALLRQPPGADMCTVCLIMLTREEQHGVRLTIALAGHPPPLLISPRGDVAQVGHSGTILGVVDPLSISESELTHRRGGDPAAVHRRRDRGGQAGSPARRGGPARALHGRTEPHARGVSRAHRARSARSRAGSPARRHRAAGAPHRGLNARAEDTGRTRTAVRAGSTRCKLLRSQTRALRSYR